MASQLGVIEMTKFEKIMVIPATIGIIALMVLMAVNFLLAFGVASLV